MTKACKDCGEVKKRIRSKRRRQVSRFYYVDGGGRLWNGHQCPDCKNPPKDEVPQTPARRAPRIDFNEDFLYVA